LHARNFGLEVPVQNSLQFILDFPSSPPPSVPVKWRLPPI
jgi:hypothetical protein